MSLHRHAPVQNVALGYGVVRDKHDPNDRREKHVYVAEFNDKREPGVTHMRILEDGVVVPQSERRFERVLTANERADFRSIVATLARKLKGKAGAP